MVLLLNLLFGFVAGILADFILGRCKVTDPLKIVVAVIVGLVVFLASQVVN